MDLFKTRKGSGSVKTPSFDPYNVWKVEEDFLGIKREMQVILPGVTYMEGQSLKGIHKHIEASTGQESTLPQHVINDVYSMYMNGDFKMRGAEKHTEIKHRVLGEVYNSLTKVVTENSQMASQMVTKELSIYLTKLDKQIQEEMEKNGQGTGGKSVFDGGADSQSDGQSDGQEGDSGDSQSQEGAGAGKGSGAGDSGHGKPQPGSGSGSGKKSTEDIVNDALDSSREELKNALDKAEKTMKDLEEKIGKGAMKDLDSQDLNFLDEIDSIKQALNRVSVNKDSIKSVLAKILNKSQNYFSKNATVIEESIFDAEELEDLVGLEYLHPIFGLAGILDVANETKLYTGKIDLYLDCSGSMGSSETFEGTNIRMIDLVKGIAMVLFRMGMIEKLYFFSGRLYEIENINEFTILGFDKGGGTDFNRVVEQCISNGRNSVVITDGEDSVDKYIKNVFWIGVGGTRFTGYGGEGAFKDYRKSGQCVTYNSSNSLFEFCKK